MSVKNLLAGLLSLYTTIAANYSLGGEPIKICTDINYWYPFSYADNTKAKGMHIDIVAKALEQLGHAYEFTPLPWKRCLNSAKEGKYDAVVSASYKPTRAKFLHYPEDAKTAGKSAWRITQVEYSIVTHKDNPYMFSGNISNLPQPVRAPYGYSIVDDLKKSGIEVNTDYSTVDNFMSLARSGKGSLVTPAMNAAILAKDPRFEDHITVHKIPFKSKSYYFVFSKKTPSLSMEQIGKIWDKVATVREDANFMSDLVMKY